MNTTLAIALVVPWIFWGVLMGLLIASGRSWINLLLIFIGINVLILAIAGLSSELEAFWFSLILHLFLLVFFTGSYVSFIFKEHRKKK